jgi:hypothetical protein
MPAADGGFRAPFRASAKMRVFNKSFGLAGFCPKRRSATKPKLFSPKACVDTERLKSRTRSCELECRPDCDGENLR